MASDEPISAVSVALVRGDRILLVKRGRAPARGLYAFPGGRVEEGETQHTRDPRFGGSTGRGKIGDAQRRIGV